MSNPMEIYYNIHRLNTALINKMNSDSQLDEKIRKLSAENHEMWKEEMHAKIRYEQVKKKYDNLSKMYGELLRKFNDMKLQ